MEKLQRQRALLHEHLRWLESEIATEASAPTPARTAEAPSPAEAAPVAALEPNPATKAPAVEAPEADVRGIHNEVRSGCLLYFAIAFVILAAVVGFVYWRY